MNLTSKSSIQPLLERYGFSFSKSLGQNFLINAEIPRKIAEAGTLSDGECDVIEVGPGIGCLTVELSKKAKRVVTFEIDKKLIPVLDETLSDCQNVTVINEDIMKADVAAVIKEYDLKNVCVCANLPYYITTPVIMKFLESEIDCKQITVMIQKEVADRFCAAPGSAEYGSVTASIAYYANVEKHFKVSADNFMPRPKVNSTVISFVPRETPPVDADKKTLFRVIKAAFAMRRKTLANNLAAEFGLSKDDALAILAELGFQPTVRGEALSLEEYAKIANRIYL